MTSEAGQDRPRVPIEGGLCPVCRHVKIVESAKGSTFLRCTLAGSESAYRKYPPQPVLACPGFAR